MTRDELVRSLCTPLPDVVRQRKESGDLAGAIRAAERHRFYFGNLDPWRVVYDSALQQEFVPPKKFMRYDPYDSQTAEIEYEDRGLMRSDFRVERILEKCEDL